MKSKEFYKRHLLDLGLVHQAKFNPYYPVIQSGLDDQLSIGGQRYIDLASNNYLGLANDDRLKQAYKNAIDKYGASLCATPVASGYSDLHQLVEKKLSQFVGLESTIIYPSCYQANNGLFTVIANNEDIALVDRCAHSSLYEGIKSSGCKIWPYLHNDLVYIEKILKKSGRHRNIFIVTESVFSTEGTIAPFKNIVDLCEQYDAIPIIDDSHGIGVLGDQGKGILEHAGIKDYNGIYTASLGKAWANAGGMISGKKSLIDFMKYYSSHLVYSTSLLPSVLAGINAVLEIIIDEFSALSHQIWNNKKEITSSLLNAGFNLTESTAPITSIKAGNSLETIQLAKQLYENNILTTPFIYPSVQQNEGRIRLIAGANIKEDSIQKVKEIFMKLKISTE
ncbi:aminotransferase class I/II-fold pyridoxal phosphate-dependent enzyme [Bacteroidota bacterium]